ncbi:MAG: AIR synthase-related protein, partial [Armatimonadota bacterium]|nr:AIR synthase-related protein [Armatimonadota bacterium]
DVSDGPAGDLQRLCGASRVGARVDAASLPLSPALREAAVIIGHDPFQWALSGGEDYELLLCVPPDAADRALDIIAGCGSVKGTIIGEIRPPEEGIQLRTLDGHMVALSGGFTHF